MELGISPLIFGYDIENGLLITEFIEGVMPTPERMHDLKFRKMVINNFRLLHSYLVDQFLEAEKNMFKVCQRGYNAAKHLIQEMGDISSWLEFLDSFKEGYYDGIAKAYCHGDIYFGNLLEVSCGRVYFIDWEYAFFGYVINDLGKFSEELTNEEILQVVEEYWGTSEMFIKMKQNVFMHSLYHFF